MSKEAILNNRNVRKQILLTPLDSHHLKVVSDFTGLSQNEIINKALAAYLARYKKRFNEDEDKAALADEYSKKAIPQVKIEGSKNFLPEEE